MINAPYEYEYEYLDELSSLVDDANLERDDRTGVGCVSHFGTQLIAYNVADSFPLLTSKRVFFRGVVEELLWMLRGDTNVKSLQAKNVHIWDEWCNEDGELGPVYGAQWRSWRGADGTVTDQIVNLVESLKHDPYSRRHIVNAWNVGELDKMALPPCHMMFQCFVRDEEDGKYLDMQLYQRSGDIFLGVPFNVASYSLLLMMLAQITGYKAGHFYHTFGDLHLYMNHVKQANEQLLRPVKKTKPVVKLNPDIKALGHFTWDDIELENYRPLKAIKAQVAV